MRPSRFILGRLALALALSTVSLIAQAPQTPAAPKPTTAKPSTAKPSTAKPSTAKPSGRKPAPAAAVAPAPPPATDVRYKVRYTTGDKVTESTAFLHGTRERFELSDMVLIRQHDQKRAVQISRASKTYLVTPLGTAAPAASVEPSPGQKPAGIVLVTTTIVDTGERKDAFGTQARHIKTMIERQPQAGACDPSKNRIETDGWYIDAPKGLVEQQDDSSTPPAGPCRDEIKTSVNGDASGLGFPIGYTTTFFDGENKPNVMTMEVVEFEITRLDAALFEIPEGLTAAMNSYELSTAVSNANEQKLAAEGPVVAERKPGSMRVGVPEVVNKTTHEVDTRALRTRLIAELTDAKIEAIPFAATSQEELDRRAKELGCDYLLIAQISELKASKPGGLSRMMKATAGQADAAKDVTEAKLTVQLVPAGGGKPRYSTNTSGKDGGMGVKTGLGLARVAGSLYLRYASPLGALNSMGMMNMGGMGMLGNPMLMQMQGGGVMGTGRGLDRTASAGMFLMDQAMAGASARPDGGPSFDAALDEALDEGAKKVVENLRKK